MMLNFDINMVNAVIEQFKTLEHSKYFIINCYLQADDLVLHIRSQCKICRMSYDYSIDRNYLRFMQNDPLYIDHLVEQLNRELYSKMKDHLLENHVQMPYFQTTSWPSCASDYPTSLGTSGYVGRTGTSGAIGISGSSGSSGTSRNSGTSRIPRIVMDYNEETNTVMYSDGGREVLTSAADTPKSKFRSLIEKILDLNDEDE